MKDTLLVNGREMTFSEVVQRPTEGGWFEVNPQAIDQNFFHKEKKDLRQEETRQLILEAFAEVKSNPERYGKKFKTKIPKKLWYCRTVEELKRLACKFGGNTADWVEQALEWAQRICNGESWETVCNNADTAKYYRMVIWKNGYARLIGGSQCWEDINPASDIGVNDYCSYDSLDSAVPLIVCYEK